MTFITLMVVLIIIGIITVLIFGTGAIVVFLIFGDVIVGAFLVYKIIKAIARR